MHNHFLNYSQINHQVLDSMLPRHRNMGMPTTRLRLQFDRAVKIFSLVLLRAFALEIKFQS
jgi:hypothetical protein